MKSAAASLFSLLNDSFTLGELCVPAHGHKVSSVLGIVVEFGSQSFEHLILCERSIRSIVKPYLDLIGGPDQLEVLSYPLHQRSFLFYSFLQDKDLQAVYFIFLVNLIQFNTQHTRNIH